MWILSGLLGAAETCAITPVLQHICLSAVLSHWQECQGDGKNLFSLQCNRKPITDASQALSNTVGGRLYFYMVKAKQLPIFQIPTENTAFVTSTEKKTNNVSAFSSSYANVRNRILSVYLIILLPEWGFSNR